MTENSH